MSTTMIPILPLQDEGIHDVTPADAVLLRRLGLTTLPAHETLFVSLDQLIVQDAPHITRSAKRLVKSIQRVGVLQPPSVVLHTGDDLHDPDATFEVIAGRRRVLAAGLAGLSILKCEAYAASTFPFSALLALIENEQRSAAWIKEVEALRRLLDEKVGMTMDDLAAFGFDRAQLAERLKIAQLPATLLTRILAGKVSREVARKLIRLTNAQQVRVVAQVAAEGNITAEQVKEALRVQIDAGLQPVQTQLAQGWNVPPVPILPSAMPAPFYKLYAAEKASQGTTPDLSTSEHGSHGCTSPAISASPLVTALESLQVFAQSAEYRCAPQAVQMLTTALIQQLRLSTRQALPMPDSTVSSQPEL
jgi:ParB/RepB/Spo0J family partition protein